MSEENTKEFENARPILERILSRLDSMDERLVSLEDKFERREKETKPMWERALAEILEVKETVQTIERKLDIMNHDLLDVRADQQRIDKRMDQLERKPS